MTLECQFLRQRLASWFPVVNSPIWPHALGFVSGFLGGDLPLLWTLHHWRCEISELHLWFVSGLFVKHNCLPGPEPSLDSEKVKFYLIIVFYLNNPDGWSLLEIVDFGSHRPKDEQSPGLGFVGKIFVSVLEAVGIWRQDVGAGGDPCHSLLSRYCVHLLMPFPQPYLWSGVYSNQVSLALLCMAETQLQLTGRGELSGSENQGREETLITDMASKHPKARAALCLILLVAASLWGLSGSQVRKSSEKTCWFCFIRIPNPDPPTMATGFGSHENMAFSMIDKWFSGRC